MAHPLRRTLRLEAPRSWQLLNLAELWEYRELLFFFVWRDVKVGYKQTVLGAAWAILQPVMTMAVFTVLFGRLAKMPSDGIPYPIFAYAALVPWFFFSNSVASGTLSLIAYRNIVTKTYFPREIVPLAQVCSRFIDFFAAVRLWRRPAP